MSLNGLFVSKSESELELISKFCWEHQIRLKALPFISFRQINNSVETNCLIYFFGSKNAFDFYLNLARPDPAIKLACVGLATKKHIEDLGFTVSFHGEEAGNPEEVARQLLAFSAGARIAFFQSSLSKRSISDRIPTKQKEEFTIYETILHSEKMDDYFDCYVFTSPSNVEAFFENNTLPFGSKTIAWGKVTETALKKQGISADFVLKKATQAELIDVLEVNFL